MLTVALFGLGGVAERIHLPALSKVADLRLTSACEPNPDRRETMRARFGVPSVYPDAHALLARERPDIVIIGSPPASHRDLCLLALDRGAHVFCEKPFVGSVAEADDVIAAATRTGRHVAVNNQYRYMAIYEQTRQAIARGTFGRPYLLQCWQQMFHPPAREQNWRADLLQSTLFEFGTHALDLISFLFDALPICISAHIPHPRPDIAADVIVVATMRFADERVATIVFNRISQAPERYLEMRVDCEEASLRISLGGVARASLDWSKALGRPTLRCSVVRGGEARVEAGGRSRVIAREHDRAFASATAKNLRGFADAVRSGGYTLDAARHARELIRLVFAGYESARTGETVWLQPSTVLSS